MPDTSTQTKADIQHKEAETQTSPHQQYRDLLDQAIKAAASPMKSITLGGQTLNARDLDELQRIIRYIEGKVHGAVRGVGGFRRVATFKSGHFKD